MTASQEKQGLGCKLGPRNFSRANREKASESDLTFVALAAFAVWHWTCRWVAALSIIKFTQLLTVVFTIQTCRRIGTDLVNAKRLWLKDKPINTTQDPLLTIKLCPFKSSRGSISIYY